MDRRIGDIEYEQMLLSRHTIAGHRRGRMLERSSYLLLSRIRSDGPRSIGELSEALRLDASTLQRQTAAAVRDGLLERVDDPAGGIARKFALTDFGLESLVQARDRSVAALERILVDWTDEEVAAFADALHRFNVDIEEYAQLSVHSAEADSGLRR
ncbi:MAG TPA: MarR family transcriptional regulator [Rhodococcus sp. (in: high G+C Gram-positive bacteria)]|jgi:DNA-binding MarR family transcriptional regulator|nr:MarR family transcriptional regulator [Rhodococcus sp. (in: high G+C Gram-positive bacteria)]